LSPENFETSIVQTFGHQEKVSTADEQVPTMEASDTGHLNEYRQIIGLFRQIAQRTGDSVSSLILEWALLHARINMVETRVAHSHDSDAMTVHECAFEEKVNKAIELVGSFLFVNFPGY
jgi:hypothetical protein